MNPETEGRRARAALALGLALAGRAAGAEVDLALVRDGDGHLTPTLEPRGALFQERNAWFGRSRAIAGDHVGLWGEVGVMPGLEGALALEGLGTVRARADGVWTTTQLGLDAAGSNLDERHPEELTREDAYVGWSSGDLFPSLGNDAIGVSIGSQRSAPASSSGTGRRTAARTAAAGSRCMRRST